MDGNIDQFAHFKTRLDEFENEVQNALSKRTTSVAEVIQTYKDQVNQIQASQQVLLKRLSLLQQQEHSLEIEIETFRKDADDIKTKIEAYEVLKQRLESQRASILEESTELDKMLAAKEKELKEYKEKLLNQRKRDNPEVKLYEKLLGMRIDASQPGTLHFQFQQFDDTNMDHSCDLTLDVSGDKFTILSTSPELEKHTERMQLVDILNTQSDIPAFLMEARQKLISIISRPK